MNIIRIYIDWKLEAKQLKARQHIFHAILYPFHLLYIRTFSFSISSDNSQTGVKYTYLRHIFICITFVNAKRCVTIFSLNFPKNPTHYHNMIECKIFILQHNKNRISEMDLHCRIFP